MRIVQCAALFLPLFLCADSPIAPSSEHRVRVELHDSLGTTTILNPVDLASCLPGLLPYGFMINTESIAPKEITVKDKTKEILLKSQRFNIPKDARALLLTLPKHNGKEFCQDIQLTPLPLQLSTFKEVKLEKYHVPIYLQFAETAAQIEQVQKKNPQKNSEDADSPMASTTQDNVQIQLHNCMTIAAYLKPLDLTSVGDLPGLLPYGFIINTNRVTSEKIIVNRRQKISIPKNAKALLLTLTKHKGEDSCQDIKLTPFTLQPPTFKEVSLEEYLVPIYLQSVEAPVQVEHGRKQKPCHTNDKEEELSVDQSPTDVFYSENKEYHVPIYSEFKFSAAQTKNSRKQKPSSRKEKNEDHPPENINPPATDYREVEMLDIARGCFTDKPPFTYKFQERPPPKWPCIQVANVNSKYKGRCVHCMQPLTQTANKNLDPSYFSVPFYKDTDYTFIKIQKRIINLTKLMKESVKTENPHIIIELEIVRKESVESFEIPDQPYAMLRGATSEEIENIPEITGNKYNIYFKFIKYNIDTRLVEMDEKEPEERSPKSRRRSCIGTTSPKPKPYPTYSTFSSN